MKTICNDVIPFANASHHCDLPVLDNHFEIDCTNTTTTIFMHVIKAGLVQVRKEERGGRRGQPWFTKKIAGQRRRFHKAEADWLKCKYLKERRHRGGSIAK